MVKLGEFDYLLISKEETKQGIEKIIDESESMSLKRVTNIKQITIYQFSDKLPQSLEIGAKEAFEYSKNKLLEKIPILNDYFPFKIPKFKISVIPNAYFYDVKLEEDNFFTYPNTIGGEVVYSSVILKLQKNLDFKQEAKKYFENKLVALYDKKETDFFSEYNLLLTKTEQKIIAFATPFKSLVRLRHQVLCSIMHEAVHILTMPLIFAKFGKANEEKVYVSEFTAYALGISLLNSYLKKDYKASSFSNINVLGVKKADNLILESKGSLEKCFELVKKEIDLTLETLKRD